MARPIAASPAATVSTMSAKSCPTRSPRNAENATRLMLTASSMSSTDIRMTMTFLRLRKMPKMPMVNRMAATVREWPSAIVICSEPLTGRDMADFNGARRIAGHLAGNDLPPDAGLVAQRQHDGADHGNEKDEAGSLEIEQIAGVKQEPDGLGVGHPA